MACRSHVTGDTTNAMDILDIESDLGVYGGPNNMLEIHRTSNDEIEELLQLCKSWNRIEADFLAGNMELGG